MSHKTILITGGAGFVGSHLADELLRKGYRVRVLDSLAEQAHAGGAGRPAYLNTEAEFLQGSVCDPDALRSALRGVDGVFHLAAAVGVGQSMYEISHYMNVNSLGTAVLLEALIQKPVERLVVASSMSVYGEGLYRTRTGAHCEPPERTAEHLRSGEWEMRDALGGLLEPVPTPETKTCAPASVYALSKYDQERLCLTVGRAYGVSVSALRLFNVFGPRQALSNPYTGILAVFASRLLNGRRPFLFEDGRQRRDFVSVHDVARACRLAFEAPGAGYEVINVGSGHSYTLLEVARLMAQALDKPDLDPDISGRYRIGDVRHCFADIGKARRLLAYEPTVSLRTGLEELSQWLQRQLHDQQGSSRTELDLRGPAGKPRKTSFVQRLYD